VYLVVLFASLLVFCGVTAAYLRSGYFSVFHPFTIYTLFHGTVFVFRPFLSVLLEYEILYRAFKFTPTLSDKITVIVAANLGFLAFGFFCFRQGAVPMRFRQDAYSYKERIRLGRYFPWVFAVCFPLGMWSLLTLFGQASSFAVAADMGRDAATGVIFNTSSNGYFVEAQLMLATLGAICAWLFRFRLIAIAPLLIFVVMRAGTGGRGPFVTALISTALLYLYERRQRFPDLKAIALAGALAIAFVAIGSDRGQSLRAVFGEQTDYRLTGTEGLKFGEGMDLANLEFFEYIVYVVPQRSHTYGYFNDVLQVFTEPIPRVLWKDKPFGAPFERIFLFDHGTPYGMTRSLPGEGWYSLGWIGVALWCGLCGYVLGWIYRRFVESSQGTFHTAAYLMFLPILIIGFRDGQLVTVFRQGIFYFAPIAMWVLIARYFHVPLARDLRRLDANRRRLTNQNEAERPAGPEVEADRWHHLPPAVQRRRLALEASRAGTE
jgi:oligosaccharide repeat unit polymerase